MFPAPMMVTCILLVLLAVPNVTLNNVPWLPRPYSACFA
jgi:hypothetical protein